MDFPEDVQVNVEKMKAGSLINLFVHQDDVGKVIGKQGRVAKAIRTVVYASCTSQQEKEFFEKLVAEKGRVLHPLYRHKYLFLCFIFILIIRISWEKSL